MERFTVKGFSYEKVPREGFPRKGSHQSSAHRLRKGSATLSPASLCSRNHPSMVTADLSPSPAAFTTTWAEEKMMSALSSINTWTR